MTEPTVKDPDSEGSTMVPLSPAKALGRHAQPVRDLVVEIIRSRHARAAEAHLVSESRFASGFGSQWRDLLEDMKDALTNRGFQTHTLAPAGYKIPIVNNCILYVWRVPNSSDAVTNFVSSPTRKNGFSAKPPEPMLLEPEFWDKTDQDQVAEEVKVEDLVLTVDGSMPVVLVMFHSSPGQLGPIEWAIAELDSTGKLDPRGRELIWEPEPVVNTVAFDVESFDRGTPVEPAIEPREQEDADPDA